LSRRRFSFPFVAFDESLCGQHSPLNGHGFEWTPEAPTTNLQTGQQAAGSVLPNAVEKLHSTQAALEEQEVTDWLPTVEKLSMALKERAVAARASAWAKTVEKLRNRQMALKERAATAGTTAPAGEFNRT
jgi:hypothetical protein